MGDIRFSRKILKLIAQFKPLHGLGFWVRNQLIIQDHRRRYPGEPAWEAAAPSPIQKYDVSCAQIGHQFYVIGGYENLDRVNAFIDVLDLRTNQWGERIDQPAKMAHNHIALTTDGWRFIYGVSGQHGPQCSPAIRDGFVYDTVEKKWHDFPALPEPRYAATMQLWRGRLHVIGGAMPDRFTSANDHWSIAVNDGHAVEKEWRREIPIPLGAQDRPSAIVNDALYVFGGQDGDFIRKPGSPCHECDNRTRETYFNHTFRLKGLDQKWERLADLPLAASHMSFPVILGHSIIVVGGQIYKDPTTFGQHITDVIQKYDTTINQWTIVAHTPYRIKSTAVGYYNGYLYFTTGQRDVSVDNPCPGRIDRRTWRIKMA